MIKATLDTFNKLDCVCNNAAASKGLGTGRKLFTRGCSSDA